MVKRVMPVKRRRVDPFKHDLTVCPAPAEHVRVCLICGRQPETCGHAHDKITPDSLRKSVVWCCDWKPQDPPAKPPYLKTTEKKDA